MSSSSAIEDLPLPLHDYQEIVELHQKAEELKKQREAQGAHHGATNFIERRAHLQQQLLQGWRQRKDDSQKLKDRLAEVRLQLDPNAVRRAEEEARIAAATSMLPYEEVLKVSKDLSAVKQHSEQISEVTARLQHYLSLYEVATGDFISGPAKEAGLTDAFNFEDNLKNVKGQVNGLIGHLHDNGLALNPLKDWFDRQQMLANVEEADYINLETASNIEDRETEQVSKAIRGELERLTDDKQKLATKWEEFQIQIDDLKLQKEKLLKREQEVTKREREVKEREENASRELQARLDAKIKDAAPGDSDEDEPRKSDAPGSVKPPTNDDAFKAERRIAQLRWKLTQKNLAYASSQAQLAGLKSQWDAMTKQFREKVNNLQEQVEDGFFRENELRLVLREAGVSMPETMSDNIMSDKMRSLLNEVHAAIEDPIDDSALEKEDKETQVTVADIERLSPQVQELHRIVVNAVGNDQFLLDVLEDDQGGEDKIVAVLRSLIEYWGNSGSIPRIPGLTEDVDAQTDPVVVSGTQPATLSTSSTEQTDQASTTVHGVTPTPTPPAAPVDTADAHTDTVDLFYLPKLEKWTPVQGKTEMVFLNSSSSAMRRSLQQLDEKSIKRKSSPLSSGAEVVLPPQTDSEMSAPGVTSTVTSTGTRSPPGSASVIGDGAGKVRHTTAGHLPPGSQLSGDATSVILSSGQEVALPAGASVNAEGVLVDVTGQPVSMTYTLVTSDGRVVDGHNSDTGTPAAVVDDGHGSGSGSVPLTTADHPSATSPTWSVSPPRGSHVLSTSTTEEQVSKMTDPGALPPGTKVSPSDPHFLIAPDGQLIELDEGCVVNEEGYVVDANGTPVPVRYTQSQRTVAASIETAHGTLPPGAHAAEDGLHYIDAEGNVLSLPDGVVINDAGVVVDLAGKPARVRYMTSEQTVITCSTLTPSPTLVARLEELETTPGALPPDTIISQDGRHYVTASGDMIPLPEGLYVSDDGVLLDHAGQPTSVRYTQSTHSIAIEAETAPGELPPGASMTDDGRAYRMSDGAVFTLPPGARVNHTGLVVNSQGMPIRIRYTKLVPRSAHGPRTPQHSGRVTGGVQGTGIRILGPARSSGHGRAAHTHAAAPRGRDARDPDSLAGFSLQGRGSTTDLISNKASTASPVRGRGGHLAHAEEVSASTGNLDIRHRALSSDNLADGGDDDGGNLTDPTVHRARPPPHPASASAIASPRNAGKNRRATGPDSHHGSGSRHSRTSSQDSITSAGPVTGHGTGAGAPPRAGQQQHQHQHHHHHRSQSSVGGDSESASIHLHRHSEGAQSVADLEGAGPVSHQIDISRNSSSSNQGGDFDESAADFELPKGVRKPRHTAGSEAHPSPSKDKQEVVVGGFRGVKRGPARFNKSRPNSPGGSMHSEPQFSFGAAPHMASGGVHGPAAVGSGAHLPGDPSIRSVTQGLDLAFQATSIRAPIQRGYGDTLDIHGKPRRRRPTSADNRGRARRGGISAANLLDSMEGTVATAEATMDVVEARMEYERKKREAGQETQKATRVLDLLFGLIKSEIASEEHVASPWASHNAFGKKRKGGREGLTGRANVIPKRGTVMPSLQPTAKKIQAGDRQRQERLTRLHSRLQAAQTLSSANTSADVFKILAGRSHNRKVKTSIPEFKGTHVEVAMKHWLALARRSLLKRDPSSLSRTRHNSGAVSNQDAGDVLTVNQVRKMRATGSRRMSMIPVARSQNSVYKPRPPAVVVSKPPPAPRREGSTASQTGSQQRNRPRSKDSRSSGSGQEGSGAGAGTTSGDDSTTPGLQRKVVSDTELTDEERVQANMAAAQGGHLSDHDADEIDPQRLPPTPRELALMSEHLDERIDQATSPRGERAQAIPVPEPAPPVPQTSGPAQPRPRAGST